jgi:type VI secretion system protein ImpH
MTEGDKLLAGWCDLQQPWHNSFIGTMRALSAKYPEMPLPGTACLPHAELFRIRQRPSMQFAPAEIAGLALRNGKLDISLYGLGVWGPQGAMPLHMTESVLAKDNGEDNPQVCFVDLFHHRMLSLFYRAWSAGQSAAALDRENERFSDYVGCLSGVVPHAVTDSAFGLHPRLASSAHLVRQARNPDGICQSVTAHLGIAARIEEYILHWICLDAQAQSQLGRHGTTSLLGEGAVLGAYVPDCQHRFRLVLGPLSLTQYLTLIPGGEALPVLSALVRTFIGYEYAWEVQLLLFSDQAVPAICNASHGLGFSTWLGVQQTQEPIAGVVFEPEGYV